MNWHPFTKVGKAIGVTLWKWNRKKIELWWTPKDYSPKEHAHDGCAGEFTILWARNRWIYRKSYLNGEWAIRFGDEYVANTPAVWGKWLTVPAGAPHKFWTGDSFMLWVVVETWKPGYDMSLASDFRVTE